MPCLLIAAGLTGGCVEIAFLLGQGGARGSGAGIRPGDDDVLPPGNGTAEVPVVTLTASNTSPQVGEEVTEEVLLSCLVQGGQHFATSFAFQPDDGRLIVDGQAGTASFIPSAADVGQGFSFTCTAKNDAGTSEPSEQVIVIPQAANSAAVERADGSKERGVRPEEGCLMCPPQGQTRCSSDGRCTAEEACLPRAGRDPSPR